jgi:hypothetical protein
MGNVFDLRALTCFLGAWEELAQLYKWRVVVLEFSKKLFPGPHSYNLGDVFGWGRALNTANEWSFLVINQLFTKFAGLVGNACSK